MSELKRLDEYSGHTTDQLLALEGKYRADSLVLAFVQALNQKSDRIGSEGLTEEERIVLAIEALEREVNNGGFERFFINAGEYVPVIVDALNRIACADVAKLTRHAIDCLGIKGPVSVDAVERVMERESDAREERLEECDDRYCDIAGDLAGPLLEFIKRNRNKITLND